MIYLSAISSCKQTDNTCILYSYKCTRKHVDHSHGEALIYIHKWHETGNRWVHVYWKYIIIHRPPTPVHMPMLGYHHILSFSYNLHLLLQTLRLLPSPPCLSEVKLPHLHKIINICSPVPHSHLHRLGFYFYSDLGWSYLQINMDGDMLWYRPRVEGCLTSVYLHCTFWEPGLNTYY